MIYKKRVIDADSRFLSSSYINAKGERVKNYKSKEEAEKERKKAQSEKDNRLDKILEALKKDNIRLGSVRRTKTKADITLINREDLSRARDIALKIDSNIRPLVSPRGLEITVL